MGSNFKTENARFFLAKRLRSIKKIEPCLRKEGGDYSNGDKVERKDGPATTAPLVFHERCNLLSIPTFYTALRSTNFSADSDGCC